MQSRVKDYKPYLSLYINPDGEGNAVLGGYNSSILTAANGLRWYSDVNNDNNMWDFHIKGLIYDKDFFYQNSNQTSLTALFSIYIDAFYVKSDVLTNFLSKVQG